MRILKLVMMLGLGAMVSACASVDTATRNVRFEPETLAFAQTMPSVSVGEINVTVPERLKVSERNSYLPGGDIVWRGDAAGNRHEQVKAIFDAGLLKGTEEFDGAVTIGLDVRVERFHALTEKARYTTGGIHSIIFAMQIRDLSTGAVIGAPRTIKADLDGLGGQRAIDAEAEGLTQKVRITQHLANVIRQELGTANGYENPKLGFMQTLNNI